MLLKASIGVNLNINSKKRLEINTYKLPINLSNPNKLKKLLTTI
jgi:hypothetical protein